MATKNKTPLRQCTGCREMKSKKEMIRVLKTTEEEQECLEKAVKSRGLERSLKMAVPAEVYEDLKKELANIEKQQ